MSKLILLLPILLIATPATASQGILCETLEGPKRVISLMAGTHAAATWSANEKIDDRWVDRPVGQHWVDSERLYVDLIDPATLARTARIEAVSEDGFKWVGALRTEERTQSLRCEQN